MPRYTRLYFKQFVEYRRGPGLVGTQPLLQTIEMSHTTSPDPYYACERRDAAIHRALGHASALRILRQLRGRTLTGQQLFAAHGANRLVFFSHLRTLLHARLIRFEAVNGVPTYTARTQTWPDWLLHYIQYYADDNRLAA